MKKKHIRIIAFLLALIFVLTSVVPDVDGFVTKVNAEETGATSTDHQLVEENQVSQNVDSEQSAVGEGEAVSKEDSSSQEVSSTSSSTTEASEVPAETSSEAPVEEPVFTSLQVEYKSVAYHTALQLSDFKVTGIYEKESKNETGAIEKKEEKKSIDTSKWTSNMIQFESTTKKDQSGKAVVYKLEDVANYMGTYRVKINYEQKKNVYVTTDDMLNDDAKTNVLEVVPAKVTNVQQTAANSSSVTITWDAVEGAVGYQFIAFDMVNLDKKNRWDLFPYGGPTANKVKTNSAVVTVDGNKVKLEAGKDYYYKIRAFYGDENNGEKPVVSADGKTTPAIINTVFGEASDEIKVSTAPDKVKNVTYGVCSDIDIEVDWNATPGADGYIIKRRENTKDQWTTIAVLQNSYFTSTPSYLDAMVKSANTYYYRVQAYRTRQDFVGKESDSMKCSTAPVKAKITAAKAGDGRIRIKWKKSASATGYNIYMKEIGEDNYTKIDTVLQGTYVYVKKDLENTTTYNVYVESFRDIAQIKQKDVMLTFAGEKSAIKELTPKKVKATSKKAKYFKTKKKFKKSSAYKKIKWFRKYVSYKKSYVMPGITYTNVAGFEATAMCPQGITFAGSYLLMSAYDYDGVENSVIYVMKKSNKKLMTTIVLEDSVHVGGIAYDGHNIWVSHGENVVSIPFSQIKEAASSGEAYRELKYAQKCKVDTTASFLTYTKGMLFVGKNVERGNSTMYSYTIENKNTTPTLTKNQKMTIPNRVQGIAFDSTGNMILSRSNLPSKAMGFYMSQLEYYKPVWSDDTIKKFGKCKNKCAMPSMNEGIAINGSYTYVCYESCLTKFGVPDQQMDRICAFKTSYVQKKKK